MKSKLTFAILILIGCISFAQNGINYKAVIKDGSGAIVANDIVLVQFTILDGATNIYRETHSPTTNANGIIIINVGEGTPISGTFSTIDWSSNNHFLNVQVNLGAGLQNMGTTAFKSVPYAFIAKDIENSIWSKNGTTINYTGGNVGIGTDNPADALQVIGRIRFETIEYFEDGGSSEIAANADLRPTSDNTYDLGTATHRWDDVFATNGTINTSDRRDKSNIRDVAYGLDEIMRLQPVRFNWIGRVKEGEKLGLIAQDLLQVIPEVVKTHDWQAIDESENSPQRRVEMERMGVYYSDLIPVLIKAIQELKIENDALRNRIEVIENN